MIRLLHTNPIDVKVALFHRNFIFIYCHCHSHAHILARAHTRILTYGIVKTDAPLSANTYLCVLWGGGILSKQENVY